MIIVEIFMEISDSHSDYKIQKIFSFYDQFWHYK